MALVKEIVLENGVTVNYHRISSVNSITNQKTLIEVASYTSKEKREEEKEAIKNSTEMNVFIDGNIYSTDFNKELNVDSAYEYLKTLDIFKNSIDD